MKALAVCCTHESLLISCEGYVCIPTSNGRRSSILSLVLGSLQHEPWYDTSVWRWLFPRAACSVQSIARIRFGLDFVGGGKVMGFWGLHIFTVTDVWGIQLICLSIWYGGCLYHAVSPYATEVCQMLGATAGRGVRRHWGVMQEGRGRAVLESVD
jgi:hypothetical protein